MKFTLSHERIDIPIDVPINEITEAYAKAHLKAKSSNFKEQFNSLSLDSQLRELMHFGKVEQTYMFLRKMQVFLKPDQLACWRYVHVNGKAYHITSSKTDNNYFAVGAKALGLEAIENFGKNVTCTPVIFPRGNVYFKRSMLLQGGIHHPTFDLLEGSIRLCTPTEAYYDLATGLFQLEPVQDDTEPDKYSLETGIRINNDNSYAFSQIKDALQQKRVLVIKGNQAQMKES